MFKRNANIETVPVAEYTDFTERLKGNEYATKKTMIAAMVPLTVAVPIVFSKLTSAETILPATSVLAQSPTYIPVNMSSPEVIQTGIIADTSLEMLANVLDPLINIMVAISFPIASVIMIGGAFFFMIGNSEKAWSTIMNAGLGYVLIQLSPMLLNILRQVGEAV